MDKSGIILQQKPFETPVSRWFSTIKVRSINKKDLASNRKENFCSLMSSCAYVCDRFGMRSWAAWRNQKTMQRTSKEHRNTEEESWKFLSGESLGISICTTMCDERSSVVSYWPHHRTCSDRETASTSMWWLQKVEYSIDNLNSYSTAPNTKPKAVETLRNRTQLFASFKICYPALTNLTLLITF